MVSPEDASMGNSGPSQPRPLHTHYGWFPPGAPQTSQRQLQPWPGSPPQPACGGEALATAPNISEMETSFIFFPLLCRSAVWISGWWRRSRSTITDSRRPSNILAEAPGARWPGTGCGCLARAQRPPATWGGVYLTGKWQAMVLGGSLHLLVRMLLVVLGEPHSGYGKGTRWKGSAGLCYLGLRLGGAGE